MNSTWIVSWKWWMKNEVWNDSSSSSPIIIITIWNNSQNTHTHRIFSHHFFAFASLFAHLFRPIAIWKSQKKKKFFLLQNRKTWINWLYLNENVDDQKQSFQFSFCSLVLAFGENSMSCCGLLIWWHFNYYEYE